jgi:hypothetical protein
VATGFVFKLGDFGLARTVRAGEELSLVPPNPYHQDSTSSSALSAGAHEDLEGVKLVMGHLFLSLGATPDPEYLNLYTQLHNYGLDRALGEANARCEGMIAHVA